FAYTYGPSTVMVNCFWGEIVGSTWISFMVLQLLLRAILVLLSLAVLYRLNVPVYCLPLSIVALPFFYRFEYSIGNGAEKICLISAGLALMYRCRSLALVMSALAASFRPGCGIVMTCVLVAWSVLDLWSTPERAIVRAKRTLSVLAPTLLI